MIILGLNAYHGDAAACLLRDGVVIAAAEEERFRRIKHWAGFPSEAIRFCLKEAGAVLGDVDGIAINSDPRANIGKRLLFALAHQPSPKLVLDRLRNQNRRFSIDTELARAFPGEKFAGVVHRVEHHRAHMASAYFASPFPQAVVVSLDGFGDFASAAWGVGEGNALRIDARVNFPHSLGAFYQAITQYLGFPLYGDEYKVMGLAPYGAPTRMAEMRRIVRLREHGDFELDITYFRHHREKIDYRWRDGAPHVGVLYAEALVDLLGPARAPDEPLDQRVLDIARSAQEMYEEAFFHLLAKLHARYGDDRLALAGGCGMNSVANGKIARRSGFKHVYVAAAAGDAGGAIGAALQAASGMADFKRQPMFSAYLGPSSSAEDIASLLDARRDALTKAGVRILDFENEGALCRFAAQAISEGKILGWCQGRMEWGPRALGNRSILADPRRADMKDILNRKIKRRESFRPFAPSILAECVDDWFEENADVPFMTQVFQIHEAQRARVPAITHVDGSGRLQTVSASANPRYHGLISAFHKLTEVPIVLNTSFNENEPIVCTPQEALECFLRTNMDMLALGDTVISRHALEAVK